MSVGEVVVCGSFLSESLIAQTKARLEAAFLRNDGVGSLVVHLRQDRESENAFDVSVAYLDTDGTRDVRDEVRERLGLPPLRCA